jgi:hypothetical protein
MDVTGFVQIDKESRDPACFHIGHMKAVWIGVGQASQGWVEADPTLIGIVIGAITLASVLYVVRRIRAAKGVE